MAKNGKEKSKGLSAALRSIFGKITLSYEAPKWTKGIASRGEGKPLSEEYASAENTPQAARASKRKGKKGFRSIFTLKRPLSFVFYGFLLSLLVAALLVFFGSGPKAVDFAVQPPPLKNADDSPGVPPVKFDFSGSAAKLELVDGEIAEGAALQPPMKGKWIWNGDAQIVFFPEEEWAVGRDYLVSFDAGLFSDKVILKRRSCVFRSQEFRATLERASFYVDPASPTTKRLTAELSFTHPVKQDEFEKAVKLDLPFTVSYDTDSLKAFIVSANIPVPKEAYSQKLKIAGKISSTKGGPAFDASIQTEVRIPGLYDSGALEECETTIVRSESYEYRKVLLVSANLGMRPVDLEKAISVHLLPKDRPESPGARESKDHEWFEAEVDEAVLKASTLLTLASLPVEGEYSQKLSFAFEAPPGRRIYISQDQTLEFFGGYKGLAKFRAVLTVPKIPKEVKVMHDGSLLCLSGEKKISLFANDVETIEFEIGRILPDQVNHLVTQSNIDFKNPSFENWNFGVENIAGIRRESLNLPKLAPGKVQYFSFDFDKYLKKEEDPRLRYGLFYFKASEYDPLNSGMRMAGSKRLILVTDLGLLVKKAIGDGYEVYVQSVKTGSPVAGANVEVLGKNGLAVASAPTDSRGFAFFPDLSSFEREKTPVVWTAKKGEDMSFLPLESSDRFLNFSRFDTGGLEGSSDPGFVDSFIFSDRGLYRPGELMNFGLIVKAGSWKKDLSGLPLELSIEDPRGLEIHAQKFQLSPGGFEQLSYRSLDTAPTGSYQVNLYTAKDKEEKKLLGSRRVKVEEFRPDRLSIRSLFPEKGEKAWLPFEALMARVSLMNLYGTPAAGNVVKASFTLSPAALSFPDFGDYNFRDPFATDKSYEEQLPDGTTDGSGAASFEIGLSRFEEASFLLQFSAQGLEKGGGRSVGTMSSVIVSPQDSVVGYKCDGDLSFVNKGAGRRLSFIAVDSIGKSVPLPGLSLKIQELRYVSVLEKGPDNLYRYKSVEKKLPYKEYPFEIKTGGSEFSLPTQTTGDFELIISKEEGKALTSFRYFVAGTGNLARSLDRDAELQIKLEKPDYAPGETILINVKAPYTGSGLITIERDRVYARKWFKAETSASVQSIVVPDDLEGTAYVNVSFVRAIDSREIYASPLSYGVAPFSISRERRTNPIRLSVPGEAKGGSSLKIGYSSGRPGKVIVFAVDEGILQVAKYGTPDPLGHFFTKRALEVSTSQILDLILPEFSLVRSLSASGGDDEGLLRNLNPFKRKNKAPVVFWSGILSCDRTERYVEYGIPDYFNGTIRVMAVAVSDDSIGVGEKKVRVRNDFVISPNVPSILVPGDEFEVGVTVMNDTGEADSEARLKLECLPSESFELVGAASFEERLKKGEEKAFIFKVKAGTRLGEGSLEFLASSGEGPASRAGTFSAVRETVSVRPSMPYRVQIDSGRLRNAEREIQLDRKMYAEFRTVEAGASYLPGFLSYGLTKYLDSYPYGCTEQTVSKAFPLLVLGRMKEYGITESAALDGFLLAHKILRARQNQRGSFGLWAANEYTNSFVTAYAMHYLTEAKESGYPVDAGTFARGIEALKGMVEEDIDAAQPNPVGSAYAIYVLTRNGIVTTNYLNSLLGSKKLDKDWREGPIAIFLSGSYAIMKQSAEARSLLDRAFKAEWRETWGNDYYIDLTGTVLSLYIAARHMPEIAASIADKALEKIAESVSSHKYNTVSAAFSILALSEYAAKAGGEAGKKLEIAVKTAEGNYTSLALTGDALMKGTIPYGATAVRFSDSSGNPLYYHAVQSGFDLAPPGTAQKFGIEVFRDYTDAEGRQLKTAKIGSEIFVRVRIRTIDPKRKTIANIAIVDLLPSGFELVYDRALDTQAGTGSLKPDFVEPREDRILVFCEALDSTRDFVYKVKPTAKGSFALPPVFAESMYEKGVWTMQGSGGFLKVEGD